MSDKIGTRIRGKLRQCQFIDYVLSCVERYGDEEFRDYCRNRSYTTFSVKNVLPTTAERPLYYIKSGNTFSGFGAELRRTLDALYFADYFGMKPVVYYTEKYIYSENAPINGSNNPFEYFFYQTSEVEPEEIDKHAYVLFKEEHRKLIQNKLPFITSYHLSEEYIGEMGRVINKYIRIKQPVLEYIQGSIDGISQSTPMIGVHYRGTDFNTGYKRHPNAVSIEDYFSEIDQLILNHPEMQIFLATDEIKAVDAFSQKYQNRLVYFNDVFRSGDGQPVHFSENERQYHHYKLGLEILRDIVTLSKCECLVAGLSQVSYAARFFKKSYDETYSELVILDKGIHQ